jgi:hypothetical protein
VLRRIAPAIGLFFLAPWVGEFLLGNVSARLLPALPVLAPLYGGGALLIREVTRRTGRGWPTILVLGLAYGLIEAGLVDQSLFNADFEGHVSAAVTPVPGLGIDAYNTITFLVGHAVWSIAVPIAIVELLTPRRRTTPWLGRFGLLVTALLYVGGCLLIFADARDAFVAAAPQRIGAGVAAAVLIVVAMLLPRHRGQQREGRVPGPWWLGVGTFAVASGYHARPEGWLGGVVLGLVLVVTTAVLIWLWSGRRGWGTRHDVALVAGALMSYSWLGFVLTYLLEPRDSVRWAGNAVFALVAAALVWWIVRAVRRRAEFG